MCTQDLDGKNEQQKRFYSHSGVSTAEFFISLGKFLLSLPSMERGEMKQKRRTRCGKGEGKVCVSQCNVCHCWTGALLFEFVFSSTVLETLFMRRLKVLSTFFMMEETSREHFKIDPIYVSQTAASSLRPHYFGPNMQFNEPILSSWLHGPFPSTLFKASTRDGKKNQ